MIRGFVLYATLFFIAATSAYAAGKPVISTFELAVETETALPEEQKEPTLYLNFDNASLASVLNYLTDRQNMDVIPHPDLQNVKVSLLSREPMTLSQAWDTLHLLMEANGYSIVNVNGVSRVVQMSTLKQNPLPCYSSAKGVEPEDLGEDNKQIRYIYFCRNITASVAQNILTPLLADQSVQVNNALQACVITESNTNIKMAMKIVKELDTGGLRQSIKIIQLHHANAEQVARIFNENILQKDGSQDGRIRIVSAQDANKTDPAYFSKDTKIIPEPIHNKLILMGTQDASDRIAEFINKYLDIPVGEAKSRIHVKELKHAAAEKMRAMLEKIIQPPRGQGGESGQVEGNYKFFNDVVITAEEPHSSEDGGQGAGFGNRLIISCDEEDWQRLEQFIDQLDKAQPQVALEVMIVDVANDNARSLGTQLRAKEGLLGKNVNASSFMTPAANYNVGKTNVLSDVVGTGESPLSAHSTIISLGDAKSDDVWAMIRSVYKIDSSNVLSQPYLVANNNSTCRESFVTRRKIPGALTSSNSSVASGLYRQYDDVEAAIETIITPRINASGIIELKVTINVSEFKEDSSTSADKTDRKIETRAAMAAGEVLVLGGLTRSKHENSHWRVPVLSSIPIIGNLFKDTVTSKTKKDLYVFIRPAVIKPHFGLGADEYTQLKLDYAKYQVLGHDNYGKSNDPIERYFFAPEHYSVKQKLSDLAENRMPALDAFSERKNMPTEVQIANDAYFTPDAQSYVPHHSQVAMPHLNPASYVARGLLEEASLPHNMPLPGHMQQRRGVLAGY